jgi:U32 family peptidase
MLMTGWLSAFTGRIGVLDSIKVPELLVPANNLKVLKYAVNYGADAVYIGGKKFNLRSIRGNFTTADLEKGIRYAHKRGVKVYLTLNSFIYEDELDGLEKYTASLSRLELDAVIVSDTGIIPVVRKRLPGIKIHISTQANITNHLAAETAEKLGASRVNLSRELSFKSIRDIIRKSNVEVEIFAHGALCISYSGRCMLSKYMSGRDANKGECAHSCRWKYYLMEEERPNLFFPIEQDKKGTYIYNSRDLCLLPVLDRIAAMGPDSIKIEGRMKTESYVSLVTWVYRKALDLIKENKFSGSMKTALMEELDKASHRNFTTGFMFGKKNRELEDNDNVGYIKKYSFVGSVENRHRETEEAVIYVKNQFKEGESIDVLQPYKDPFVRKAAKILRVPGMDPIETANPNDKVVIKGLGAVSPYSILRKKL